MIECPSCGTGNPPNARFCLECGTRLASPRAPQEERRVVTILFVDLVGFTERSDRADPEDVRRSLVPFHSRVKADLEAFGGTLDKFIGDAVMGVFGAPRAHEDDPVRAVRASLRILESIAELRRDDPDIAVRIAVETGEAVVTFGEGPQVGEAVAGDVVNTTSRMQALAPRNGLVVGEVTFRAVRDQFETAALPPAAVKGKTEPLRVWRVLEELPQAADISPHAFIGRAHELGRLHEHFDRVVASGSAGLVTVIGEPGIGKSRLLDEFRLRVGDGTRWVTGRCLPYGEAVTMSAVAGTVRAIAGILEPGDAEDQAARLAAFVDTVETDPSERHWLRSRLGPILGIGGPGAEAEKTIPPGEIADAWARVIRSNGDGPAVVEVDDLHWAEPALLRTVDALVQFLADRPVLVLCAGRPEVRERGDGWPPDRAGVATIELSPMSKDDAGALLATLLARAVMPPDARESLLARAGGNPLYAVEFARMVGEHVGGSAPELSTPQTVQAVISARLDAIPVDLRALLLDASVVGTAFWPGALAAMGGIDDAEVRIGLEELVRRGLVERSATSAFERQTQFGFTHALIGEVAYRRIPRARRARRHCTAGTWIESESGDRADERAELLAHHFWAAVDLARAASEDEVVAFACGPAVRWLMTAGDRARRLDAGGAFALYDRAANLADGATTVRAEAIARSARMGRRSGRIPPGEVLARYEESLAIQRELGDPLRVGEALTRVAAQAAAIGEAGRAHELLDEAIEVLQTRPAGRELASALAFRAEEEMFAGRVREALSFADRALGLGARTDAEPQEEVVVMALHIRGDARCSLGDPAGLEDLERALRLSQDAGNAADIVTSGSYLGEWRWAMEGPAEGLGQSLAALEVAERRGIIDQGLSVKANAIGMLFDLGEWDRALAWAEDILVTGRDRLDPTVYVAARTARSRIASLRHRPYEADDADALLEIARPVEELHVLAPALAVGAHLYLEAGLVEDALATLHELASVTSGVAPEYRESQLAAVVRDCVRAGAVELGRSLTEESLGAVRRNELNVASAKATIAESDGSAVEAATAYARAAAGWRAFGHLPEELEALRGVARCDPTSAAVAAAEADGIARRLGMPPA